ncbi:MAG: hypothetical protein Q4G46_16735, partial [Propionibacteriaceae bacterium]|nr:hypothetical protein [Propionibacteriaceae bacterium]
TYNLRTPSGDSNPGFYANDFGSTFVLFNSTFTPAYYHYYGALGIYGTRGSPAIGNAIAVEFDNLRSSDPGSQDLKSDASMSSMSRRQPRYSSTK